MWITNESPIFILARSDSSTPKGYSHPSLATTALVQLRIKYLTQGHSTHIGELSWIMQILWDLDAYVYDNVCCCM